MDNKNIKKAIVITSIFDPTEGVIAFSKMQDYQLIVVGDRKTPADWHCENADFLSVNHQEAMDFELAALLPFNHYCRKMLGYLKAIRYGAEYIVDIDDDIIPKEHWIFPEFKNTYNYIEENKGFVNIYQLYTKQNIWPRGLPLKFVTTQFELDKCISTRECQIGIWQGLTDQDADVDAVYRLTNNSSCNFIEREPVVLGKGTLSPFNTQNTIIRKELFPLLYLPAHVTFRFTDILRGLIAQPIMWLYDYQLGFINATAVQKRNPHDDMKDFISEIPMYKYTEKVIEAVTYSILSIESIETNLYNAYDSLRKENIVCTDELRTLEVWLKDLTKLK